MERLNAKMFPTFFCEDLCFPWSHRLTNLMLSPGKVTQSNLKQICGAFCAPLFHLNFTPPPVNFLAPEYLSSYFHPSPTANSCIWSIHLPTQETKDCHCPLTSQIKGWGDVGLRLYPLSHSTWILSPVDLSSPYCPSTEFSICRDSQLLAVKSQGYFV